ncbi:MAG: alanyl-tRNA editing protein [Spirochaetaceae bacterium]|jgi:alanyl-tRNA synthetase|nr:alanyl-tRNA editing protein [Spirochaetaceae bacterium]
MKPGAAYYEYSAAAPFPATILEIRKAGEAAALILDDTIFYPEGGGQGADRGTINGASLLDVQEAGGEILHFLSARDAARLSPGPAELRLDAPRRRDFTVHHTAQHLLSGTILRLTGKPTASMRLGEEICTIDVNAPELTPDTLTSVEEAAADVIEADVLVLIHLCPPENAADFPLRKRPPAGEDVIRVVEIQGVDFSPCCGTHLKSTGPIGVLKILGAEKYKGMTRVTFAAGRRALRDYRLLRQNGDRISRTLKTPVSGIGDGVSALAARVNQLEKEIKELKEAAAHTAAESLLRDAGVPSGKDPAQKTGPGRVYVFLLPDADMEKTVRIGRAAQKLSPAPLIFGSEREGKFAAFCSDTGVDLRRLLNDPVEAAGGRGGGGPSFFQGAFNSPGKLRAFLETISPEGSVIPVS